MQGYGTLTAYAGQTATMTGVGTLTSRNYGALLSGVGTLSAKASVPATCTMTGIGTLFATAQAPTVGNAMLPALASIGGDYEYTIGYGDLPALFSTGEGGFYVPPEPTMGYGNLPCLVSSGVVVGISIANGDSSLPALVSIGGEGDYGVTGVQMLPALQSFGMFGVAGESVFIGRASLTDEFSATQEHIVIFSSSGAFVGTISGTIEHIQEIMSTMALSDSFTIIGEFSLDMISSLVARSAISAQEYDGANTFPAINGTNRTWVVNMDNMASSQYDDYGFLRFFSHEGYGYGVASDGVYKLDGNTDAGFDIESLVEFGRSDFGSDKVKKVYYVYLGVASSGKMYLKVDADEKVFVYAAETSSEAVTNNRVPIGKGLFGNFWNFTLLNKDGADFVLANVSFQPIELPRGMR